MKTGMKKRRAVGGLISLVGLVAVFGIASTAFIELNLGQASLMSTTVDINSLLIDKNNEMLNFTVNASNKTISVESLWSKPSVIDSSVLINDNIAFNSTYLGNKIQAGKQVSSIMNYSVSGTISDEVVFVTKLGNNCIIIIERGHGLC